uniref:CNH domain-containing protein n=1 Tax=Amphimedon queenslandica TaxID=400682 RepID=A0A1X7VLX9_AMPQE
MGQKDFILLANSKGRALLRAEGRLSMYRMSKRGPRMLP